jgi:hypothetical protein
MSVHKLLKYLLLSLAVLSLVFGGINQTQSGAAMPMSAVDESKVPHYFGPFPNWANSPFTLPDVAVEILGDGTGATAVATVGGNGAITGITITSPGSGYTAATVNFTTTGLGGGAAANAVVNPGGSVTSIQVDAAGSGYTAPLVNIGGGAPAFVAPSALAVPANSYSVSVGSATGGTFLLLADAATTAPIAWNALALDVETALGLVGVTATVTGSGSTLSPWIVTFVTMPVSFTLDGAGLTQGVLDASALPGTSLAVYNIIVGSATGGTFLLTVDAATTAPIAWNALAADVQTALATAGVTATVTGSGSIADPWVITFAVAPTTVSIDPAGLTQGVLDAGVAPTADTLIFNAIAGSATGGSFLLTVDGLTTAAIAWNALAGDVQTALTNAGISITSVAGTGSIADPWVITFVTAPLSVTMDSVGLTQGVLDASALPGTSLAVYNVIVGSATGGTFLLTVDGLTTAPLLWNAAALDVETALLNAGVTATVIGSGSIADPWVITFAVAPTTVTMDSALLTQGVADTLVALVAATVYRVDVGSAIGGTFLLTVDAISVGPIAWNALAADVQNALLLAGFTTGVTGSGSIADPWVITFAIAPATVAIDGTALLQPPFTGATATAYGGVDLITLVDAGLGYSFPTVDFDMPNDPNGTQAAGHVVCVEVDCIPVAPATTVTINGVVVDNPGSGYSAAPHIVIRDGTIFDPINHDLGTFFEANATATLTVQYVTVDTFGSGYTSAPAVLITDAPGGLGTGALATAFTDVGAITAINLTAAGSGYATTGGIKKFQDGLPVLCDPTAGWANCTDNNLGQHIPIAVPDTTTFTVANGYANDADYYVIAVVQHVERMSSSLPITGTLLREYVQLETPNNAVFSKHVLLENDLLGGGTSPITIDGLPVYAVDDPHFLGPVIVANKNKPVRIVFYNLLPTGSEGDLFLPTDSTLMGSVWVPWV